MKLVQWNVLVVSLVLVAGQRRSDRSTPVIKTRTTSNFNISTTTTTSAPVTYRKVYFPQGNNLLWPTFRWIRLNFPLFPSGPDENFPSAAQVDDAHTVNECQAFIGRKTWCLLNTTTLIEFPVQIPLSLLRHLSEAETMEDFLPWLDNFVPEGEHYFQWNQ
jgi:hypothetical protein